MNQVLTLIPARIKELPSNNKRTNPEQNLQKINKQITRAFLLVIVELVEIFKRIEDTQNWHHFYAISERLIEIMKVFMLF